MDNMDLTKEEKETGWSRLNDDERNTRILLSFSDVELTSRSEFILTPEAAEDLIAELSKNIAKSRRLHHLPDGSKWL